MASIPEPDFNALSKSSGRDIWWASAMVLGTFGIVIGACITYCSTKSWILTVCAIFLALGLGLFGAWNSAVKERYADELEQQGLDSPLWLKSRSEQEDEGFHYKGEYVGFQVLERPICEESPNFEGTEVIIRDNKQTLAVADVLRIHDEASWPRSRYDRLERFGEPLSLASIFEDNDVRDRIYHAQRGISDFVSLGLVANSNDVLSTTDENYVSAESLANRRGRKLGEALLAHADLNYEKSSFKSVGLGRCTRPAQRNTDEDLKQRAAVLIAIVRRQSVSERLSFERALEAVITKSNLSDIPLSEYEYSEGISSRLKNSLVDFAGYLGRTNE